VRRFLLVLGLLTVTAWLSAGAALGALVSGSLPTTGFTFASQTINHVNISDDGIRLKTKRPIDIKTTYSRLAPSTALAGGWHVHSGPVIVTVAVGTLTFYDAQCGSWDVTAGQTYLESPGEVLAAKALPDRNVGIGTVEWFTTRLLPSGATDPVAVDPPCTP